MRARVRPTPALRIRVLFSATHAQKHAGPPRTFAKRVQRSSITPALALERTMVMLRASITS